MFLVMLLAGAMVATLSNAQPFVFSGLPIESKRFHFLVSEHGMSDSFLDQKRGFRGREYLSGEWAAGMYYQGGHLSPMMRWFSPIFVFPDRINPGPHYGVKTSFHFASPPTNSSGFPVYQSIITNADLEVRMSYEIVDVGTNENGQVALGLSPASAGGMGANLWSGRYVYRQNYRVENISGQVLNNVRFYQFIHGLEASWAVYDNRDYGGWMPSYRHAITQGGMSYALHSRMKSTYEVNDTLSVLSRRMPDMVEVGLFSSTNHQDHWPESGTAVAVENNSLNGNDQIYTNKSTYVSGAMGFNFGTLGVGVVTNIDFLVAINSVYTEVYPPVNIVVHNARVSGNSFIIDFEETTDNPLVGYLLRSTEQLNGIKVSDWDILPYGYQINVPVAGRNRFTVPYNPMIPQRFYAVDPVILQ